MKIKLTEEQIQKVIDDPDQARLAGIRAGDPTWLIILKIVSTILGLIIGAATVSGCSAMAYASLV